MPTSAVSAPLTPPGPPSTCCAICICAIYKTVPFENLSIHLGEEIVLEEERLLDKVVGARRGGFCYELNGAFGALLTALGFDVMLLAGRVYGEEGRLGIPYDHLALRVRTVDGGEWLADIGFGAHSHYPLEFGARGEQADPGGRFGGSWRGGTGQRGGSRGRGGRQGSVPAGDEAAGAGGLRGRGLVAQHLAAVALHAVPGLLADHGGRRADREAGVASRPRRGTGRGRRAWELGTDEEVLGGVPGTIRGGAGTRPGCQERLIPRERH